MALRILVVDDHEAARRLINTLIGARADWQVCGEASDGVAALARAGELRPDVVLMDVSMPKMDGLQATQAIRKQLPETKIILVSQNDPAVLRQQPEHAQAHAFVGKEAIAKDRIPSIEKLVPHIVPDVAAKRDDERSTGRSGEEISAWLVGGGEMGELIRKTDWVRTPLGASLQPAM